MNSKKMLIGILAGVAAGALLGVLLAPDKGSNTRGKITRKGEEYLDELKEGFEKLRDKLTDKYDEVINEVNSVAEKGKTKSEEIKRSAKQSMN